MLLPLVKLRREGQDVFHIIILQDSSLVPGPALEICPDRFAFGVSQCMLQGIIRGSCTLIAQCY